VITACTRLNAELKMAYLKIFVTLLVSVPLILIEKQNLTGFDIIYFGPFEIYFFVSEKIIINKKLNFKKTWMKLC
jgi:hypothetical protein